MARVSYRPFEDSDFEALVPVVRELWYPDDDPDVVSDECAVLEASIDFAHCLAISTFSQVALIDSIPSGIVLARAEGAAEPTLAAWAEVEQKFSRELQERLPEACESFQIWRDRVEAVDHGLVTGCDVPAGNEIVLLVAACSARGLGIGSVLFDAASLYFSEQDQRQAYLFTDTDCTWEFYEHRGMQRLATYRAHRDERHLLPHEMYVYGMDLSA